MYTGAGGGGERTIKARVGHECCAVVRVANEYTLGRRASGADQATETAILYPQYLLIVRVRKIRYERRMVRAIRSQIATVSRRRRVYSGARET